MKNYLSKIFFIGFFMLSMQTGTSQAEENAIQSQVKKQSSSPKAPQTPPQFEEEIAERGLAYDWLESRQPSYAQNENSTYFNRDYAQPNTNSYAQPNAGYSNFYQPSRNQANNNQRYNNTYQQQYQYDGY